jgi:thioredoxin-related protein
MLTKQTFGNDTIAKYLNENYYCVKFDAENHDTLKFSMNVPDTIKDKSGKVKKVTQKAQEYKFYNTFPLDAQRSTHQFAVSILQGKQIAYPSIVFLTKDLKDGNIKRVDVIQGFYPPANFEPIMKFYGSGSWQTVKWEDFQKTFKSDFKVK